MPSPTAQSTWPLHPRLSGTGSVGGQPFWAHAHTLHLAEPAATRWEKRAQPRRQTLAAKRLGVVAASCTATRVEFDYLAHRSWSRTSSSGPCSATAPSSASPHPLFWTVLVLIFGFVLLHLTSFGRRVYATGGNTTAAHYSGIEVEHVKLAVFTLTGNLAGF